MDSTEILESARRLTSEKLLSKSKELAFIERKLGIEFMYHLYEIERRNLHLELGYSSLIEFVMKECKYPSGSAYRKVESMRLLMRMPELKDDLLSGELNLSLVSQAAQHIKNEKRHENPLSLSRQVEIIDELKGKSTREAEKILLEKASEPAKIPCDKERALTESLTEIKFVASKKLKEKLDRLKDYFSHKNPNMSFAELFENLADHSLKEFEKGFRKPEAKTVKCAEIKGGVTEVDAEKSPAPGNENKRTRFIPMALKRKVWQREGGCCTFVSALNHERCGATRLIEFEHLKPWAKGGENTDENLTLRCRAHNLHAARQTFGQKKMNSYISC